MLKRPPVPEAILGPPSFRQVRRRDVEDERGRTHIEEDEAPIAYLQPGAEVQASDRKYSVRGDGALRRLRAPRGQIRDVGRSLRRPPKVAKAQEVQRQRIEAQLQRRDVKRLGRRLAKLGRTVKDNAQVLAELEGGKP